VVFDQVDVKVDGAVENSHQMRELGDTLNERGKLNIQLPHLRLPELPEVRDPLHGVACDEDQDDDEADLSEQHLPSVNNPTSLVHNIIFKKGYHFDSIIDY